MRQTSQRPKGQKWVEKEEEEELPVPNFSLRCFGAEA
jgi:hypothetical protein